MRTNQQAVIKPFPHKECPETNCVMFGRSGRAHAHPGNVKFNYIVEGVIDYYNKYSTLPKTDESQASAMEIIEESYKRGLTFAMYNRSQFWYEDVQDKQVLLRVVKQSIKDHRKRRRRSKANSNDLAIHLLPIQRKTYRNWKP